MNIQKLNVEWLIEFAGTTDDLVICRLPNSKFFRIPFVPEHYQTKEVFEVIQTFCHAYKQGIYILKFDTEEDLRIFSTTLAYMGIGHVGIHEPFPFQENMN